MVSLFPKRDCVIQRVPCRTGAATKVTKREGRKVDQSRLADTARESTPQSGIPVMREADATLDALNVYRGVSSESNTLVRWC
jgi:hypothetical protein